MISALHVVCTHLDSSTAELEKDAHPALDELTTAITTKNLDRVRSLKGDLTRLFGRMQKLRHEFEHLLDHNEDKAQLYLTADADELEMLLEAYLFRLDGTRGRIETVREYIIGEEDCFNIEPDNRRNELMQLQLIMTIAGFAIAIESLVAGIFGRNIPWWVYAVEGIFGLVVGGMTAACVGLFFLVLGYARWKKLLGS